MSVITAPAPAHPAAVRPPPDARTRAPAKEHSVGTASPGWRRSPRIRALIVVAGVIVVALGLNALAPQLGAVDDAVRALGQVSLWWLVPLLAISALSFPGAALSLQGASPERLAFRPTIAVNVAAAFTGRLVPSSLGSMSTVALFLHRRGLSGVRRRPRSGSTRRPGSSSTCCCSVPRPQRWARPRACLAGSAGPSSPGPRWSSACWSREPPCCLGGRPAGPAGWPQPSAQSRPRCERR